MEKTIGTEATRVRAHAEPAWQAYQILHWGFVALPTLTGLDKFFHLMTNWEQYLAPSIEKLLPISPHAFMVMSGVVEVLAGLLVAVKPRIGAYVIIAWLAAIIVDLVALGGALDIALRDAGLMVGALALARLSVTYETKTS